MATIGIKHRAIGGVQYGAPPFFHTKKLAIIGRTPSAKFAPWHDPSWTIAAHPCARELCQREPDWYFDLHPPACFTNEGKSWNPAYYTWLKTKLQTPIFMQEKWPDIPMAVRFPIERVLQEFRAYFTNHPAYMIALGLQEGIEQIGIFGCEYSADTEYSIQRGSLEYWLGRAEQAGVEVILPVKESTLLRYPAAIYGYESHDLKTGKLAGDYKRKPVVTRVGDKAPTKLIDGPLDLTKPEDQAKLAPLPPWVHEPIAFDRANAAVVN